MFWGGGGNVLISLSCTPSCGSAHIASRITLRGGLQSDVWVKWNYHMLATTLTTHPAHCMQRESFFSFWDTLVMVLNSIIFVYVGASATNFTIRLVRPCVITASPLSNHNPPLSLCGLPATCRRSP